ncbi:MAG: AtpZ/AtpI family protein [Bacteroides sp.]
MDTGEKASVYRNIVLITQISLYVMVPIFLCLGVGIWLDGKFGWSTTLPLLVIGIASGARTGYVEVRRIIEAEEDRRKRRQSEEIENKVRRHGKT